MMRASLGGRYKVIVVAKLLPDEKAMVEHDRGRDGDLWACKRSAKTKQAHALSHSHSELLQKDAALLPLLSLLRFKGGCVSALNFLARKDPVCLAVILHRV
jgi:hypothetical protein